MLKDPTEFRKRFAAYKAGKMPYKDGRIVLEDEWDPNDTYTADAGMIKSKLAITSHFGNPTARRITNYDGRDYTWPGEYEYINGVGEPKRGNVYVGSYDNLVTPQILDNGKALELVDNPWNPKNEQRSYKQSLKFDNMRDAWSFGENYKKYAPMMNRYEDGKLPKYADGLTPYNKKDVNTNQALYNPEEDLYSPRYTLPEVTITGDKKKVGTGYGKRLYMRPWKTVGDLVRELNEAMGSPEERAARAPYEKDLHKPLSPVDPIGELIVGNAVLGPAFNYIGKGLSWAGNTITDEALIQAGKSGSKWAKAKAIQRTMRSPVVPEKGFGVPYDDYNYYHGGLDPDFDFSKLDPFRKSVKQAKHGKDYAGFYMSRNADKRHAFGYGGGEAHGIKVSDNAKTLQLDGNIERIESSKLRDYRNEGYDIVTGKNVWGEPEYILLNKDAIESTKFFTNAPKNEQYLLRFPKVNFNPKRNKKTIDWINATTGDKSPITSSISSQTGTNVIGDFTSGETIIPHQYLQEFRNSTLERMADMRNLTGKEREEFIKGALSAIGRKYNSTYNLNNPLADGETIWNTGTINIKPGSEDFALGHELRHKLDATLYYLNTNKYLLDRAKEYALLRKAYTGPFLDYPTDGNMLREMTTTNFDVRRQLLGPYRLRNLSVAEQNKIIDGSTGTEIMNALLNSNDYGRWYYSKLLKNPEFTSNSYQGLKEILKNIKNSLKYVGIYGAPASVAYPMINNTDETRHQR